MKGFGYVQFSTSSEKKAALKGPKVVLNDRDFRFSEFNKEQLEKSLTRRLKKKKVVFQSRKEEKGKKLAERKRKRDDSDSDEDGGEATKKLRTGRDMSSQKCFNCNEMGHIAKEVRET